jgi:hypothetical protein
MGFSHPNGTRTGGQAVALAYLDHLAHHPATAQHLATKLAVRFVSDAPSTALVNNLAAVYLRNGTAITPVLRALFTSSEFRASVGRKTRRPFESIIGTVRLLDMGPEPTGTDAAGALVSMAEGAGQPPFGAPYPTGWPDVAAAWSSTASTLNRWNSTLALAAGWWPTQLTRPLLRDRVLAGPWPATHGEALDRIATSLFGLPLAAAHRAAVLTFLGKSAGDPLTENSPLATWRLDDTVAIMLDSPYHHYR